VSAQKSSNGEAYTTHRCLVCAGGTVQQFLDLGDTALANKFLTAAEVSSPEPTYPLRVGFCHTCGHVQLTEMVPPPVMFEDYLYMSSASDTLKTHLYDLSDLLVERYRPAPGALVIDIGCNDGTLLSGFQRHGVRAVGVDPAANLAELMRDKPIERYVGFFTAESAQHIVGKWGQASIITATNTFPHIPGLRDFLAGIQTALAPGGAFVIEAHYLGDLLTQRAFDTIYHEHVSYWALGPMVHLFAQQGMEVVDAERIPLHHGQLRVSVQRQGEGRVQPRVAELLSQERDWGLDQFKTYQQFAQQTYGVRDNLHRTLKALRQDGKQVAGYGAPAKGNTLLSFLELGPQEIDYIADRSALKQGRYTPGTHIPVVSPEHLLSDQPDYVLLLAWNFADEVLAQQAEYRRRGGKFILPVPDVQII